MQISLLPHLVVTNEFFHGAQLIIRRDIFQGTPGELKTYMTEIHDHVQRPLSSFSPTLWERLQNYSKRRNCAYF